MYKFVYRWSSYARRAGLVQAVESYRLWPEGLGFESRSPRIAHARVRLATNTLPQTPHRAGAFCTGYALFMEFLCQGVLMQNHFFIDLSFTLTTLFLASLLYKSTPYWGRDSIWQFYQVVSLQDGCFYDKLLSTSCELCIDVAENR